MGFFLILIAAAIGIWVVYGNHDGSGDGSLEAIAPWVIYLCGGLGGALIFGLI